MSLHFQGGRLPAKVEKVWVATVEFDDLPG